MEEKNDDSDYEYEDEDENNNKIYNDMIVDNAKILGEKIILKFNQYGREVSIEIGINNNLYDAAIKYGAKMNIPISKIKKDYKFYFNSRAYDVENKKTLKEIGFKNGNRIEVVDHSEIIVV